MQDLRGSKLTNRLGPDMGKQELLKNPLRLLKRAGSELALLQYQPLTRDRLECFLSRMFPIVVSRSDLRQRRLGVEPLRADLARD